MDSSIISNWSSSLVLGIVSVLTVHVILFYKKVKHYPPGPTPLPLLGNVLLFRSKKHISEVVEDQAKVYGPVMTIWLGPFPQVFVSDPDMVLSVLRDKACAGRPEFAMNDELLAAPGSNNIAFADMSPPWDVLRKVTFAAIRRYTNSPEMPRHVAFAADQSIDLMLKDMEGKSEVVFEMEPKVRMITTGFICNAIFGKQFKPTDPYLDRMNELLDVLSKETLVFALLEMRDQCPFLVAFILETTRFLPVFPFTLPHKTMSEVVLRKHTLDAGTTVIPVTYRNLREEKVWKHAGDFRPERFLDQNSNKVTV